MEVFPYATSGNEENYGKAIETLMFITYSKDNENPIYKGSQKVYIDLFYKEPKPAVIPPEQIPSSFRDFLTRWLERSSLDETKAYIKSWHQKLDKVNKSLKELEDLSDDPKYKEVLYEMVSHKIKDKKCQFVFKGTIPSIQEKLNLIKNKMILNRSLDVERMMIDLNDVINTKKIFEDGSEESEVSYMSKMFEAQYAHDFYKYFIPELRRVRPDVPIVGVPVANSKGGRRKKYKTKKRSKKLSKRK